VRSSRPASPNSGAGVGAKQGDALEGTTLYFLDLESLAEYMFALKFAAMRAHPHAPSPFFFVLKVCKASAGSDLQRNL